MASPQHDDMFTNRTSSPATDGGEILGCDVSALSGRERVGLQLAHRYGITVVEALALVRYAGSRDGRELLEVASRTEAGTRYEVVYNPAADAVVGCDCPARGGCWHIGAARMRVELWHYTFERQEVYRQTDDTVEWARMRAYERANS